VVAARIAARWVLPGFKGYMHGCHFILHCSNELISTMGANAIWVLIP